MDAAVALYQSQIDDFSRRSYHDTLYSGEHYRYLSYSLHSQAVMRKKTASVSDNQWPLGHLTIFTPEKKTRRETFSHETLNALLEVPKPLDQESHVLFLCGQVPEIWITSLGAKYHIDPDFFRWHNFTSYHTSPALNRVIRAGSRLPSAAGGRCITLRLATVGVRDDLGNIRVYPYHDHKNSHIGDYGLETDGQVGSLGESIVRRQILLGQGLSFTEQDVSICVEPCDKGWIAVIWSDIGKDLTQGYGRHLFYSTGQGPSTRFLPVLTHGNRIFSHKIDVQSQIREDRREASLAQSASHLPREFDTFLDSEIACQDLLYAISPILAFGASSAFQVLTVLGNLYDDITKKISVDNNPLDSLPALTLYKRLLDERASRHEEVFRFIRDFKTEPWSTIPTKDQSRRAEQAKGDVARDYEYLANRARQQAAKCQESIALLMNTAAIAESKKQLEMAGQVTKLTILATIFLPLSFCSSIFGMNFIELENLHLWVWGAVTASIGIVMFVLYHFRYPLRRLPSCMTARIRAWRTKRKLFEAV